MLSDHVVITGQSWRDWERANCRFRPSSILVYWVPLAYMLIAGWFGLAEWTWWVVWFVSVAVGAQLTEPGWRYWVALFVWPAMIVFWGLPALFIWGIAFYATFYADGQEWLYHRQMRDWEKE
jgi:hypothetical protein